MQQDSEEITITVSKQTAQTPRGFLGKLSPALSFLSAKTEMLDTGDQLKISLNDTTKSRQQFKTSNVQSSNDSELFNNPNFDTDACP